MKQFTTTITQRGQVTLPAYVRRVLGIQPREKVTFEVEGNEVRILPAQYTVESVRGSVPALREPKSLEEMGEIAGQEHARHVLDELRGD